MTSRQHRQLCMLVECGLISVAIEFLLSMWEQALFSGNYTASGRYLRAIEFLRTQRGRRPSEVERRTLAMHIQQILGGNA